jgi:hypothetical protein
MSSSDCGTGTLSFCLPQAQCTAAGYTVCP